ncbi:gastrula zinc finger protein XlCGF7.1-like [Hemibagrus wyckioides]|uniref:gastrula zinc finger protein XlCGF7.1-like n=1 Tax=Hemibagrus wyckioides TaxID=337641 RepID=UPI00266C0996|nr:gastrula zinc finger protein XlCGF7.1-like [Hemibagrus wyckioides]XP_058242716.1 gastrula zinc finger protein XlCGF7.1-like [Hemibagrus wyckioides]
MDSEKELIDSECEQDTAGAAQCLKTTDKQQVFMLSEMEVSERVGRVCRSLNYQPKRVQKSSAEKVFDDTADLIVSDTEEASNEQDVRRMEDLGDHEISRKGYRLRKRVEKNQGYEQEAQTSSDETDQNPESPKHKRHFPKSKKYLCNLCGMEYTRKRNLDTHIRIHTGETPYTCKVCGKGFRRSDWLSKHMKSHKDKKSPDGTEKRFACDQCDRTYVYRDSLHQHRRKHMGEKPFPCAICPLRFYNNASLRKHLVYHSDDRPYTCSQCGHSFKHVGTLNKHKRIHTGEKPYSCSICGGKYAYRYSLIQHMKSSSCQRSQAT